MNTSAKKHNFKLNLLQRRRFFRIVMGTLIALIGIVTTMFGLVTKHTVLIFGVVMAYAFIIWLERLSTISDEQYQAIIEKAKINTVVTQMYTLPNKTTHDVTNSGRHAYEITKPNTTLSNLKLAKLVESADTTIVVPNAPAWRIQMRVSDFTDKRISQLVHDYCLSVNNKIDEARLLLANEEIVQPVERAVALHAQADKPKLPVNPTKELVYEVMATNEQIESYMSTHLTFDVTDFVKYVNV